MSSYLQRQQQLQFHRRKQLALLRLDAARARGEPLERLQRELERACAAALAHAAGLGAGA